MKTVVIDDDKNFADVMCGLLNGEGCTVTIANSLSSARDLMAGKDWFDAIFLDIWLDNKSSLVLIDELQSAHPNVPVILMSGGGGPLSLQVATSIAEMKGIAGFLQKPIRRARLAALVRELRAGF